VCSVRARGRLHVVAIATSPGLELVTVYTYANSEWHKAVNHLSCQDKDWLPLIHVGAGATYASASVPVVTITVREVAGRCTCSLLDLVDIDHKCFHGSLVSTTKTWNYTVMLCTWITTCTCV